MDRKEILERLKIIRENLKAIEDEADMPLIERHAQQADIFCRTLENHLDETKGLWI